MSELSLHELHAGLNAQFAQVNAMEVVSTYGDTPGEYAALRNTVGVLDLSFRSRICLLGADRKKFLHGQVTNDVNNLKTGEGCYAALITAKGKMQSDLYIFSLENELLLDFEPGLTETVSQRLDKYIIADDVQIVDVAPHYGLLSVQGPKSAEAIQKLELDFLIPEKPLTFTSIKSEMLGDLYLVQQARAGTIGFDLFVPLNALGAVADKLIAAAKELGGRPCGWDALELARIEAGIPRFLQDMDETNLPPETGMERNGVSYTKGCYIGQEVIARIRTYGQVAKALRGLRFVGDLQTLPKKGDKLFLGEKDVGYVTSAIHSPSLNANIGLGYVRREANKIGTEITLRTADGESAVTVLEVGKFSG
ncbi:MAG: aminomethyl transferase family protein [Verrucomicrobia bacterium]|nr:aminomethyl transferase family protein [Verrucomicrobiota bacterium]